MLSKSTFNNYNQLKEFLTKISEKERVIILFTGSSTENGTSWCPDCVAAEPVIEKVLEENKDKAFHFVKTAVGSRAEWRDPKCVFRTDPRMKLTSVPTLLLWGTVERLNDSECQDPDNIRLLFEGL